MPLKKTIIEPSWEAKYSFSPAVITEGGKTIWLAGHVGFVDDAGASLAGNFDAQVRQAFKNLEKTLQRAGGTLKDIVWMTVAVSDGRYAQRFTDIRKEIYGGDFPASTLLTAASFAVPEIMVEITPIAVVAGWQIAAHSALNHDCLKLNCCGKRFNTKQPCSSRPVRSAKSAL